MELLIFRTNIAHKKSLKAVKKVFKEVPDILDWTVDMEDIDKVLRVELGGLLTEEEVIALVKQLGLNCEVLEG